MFQLFAAPLMQSIMAACDKPRFLGLLPWYQYLDLKQVTLEDKTTVCQIQNFSTTDGLLGTHSPILLIAFAILDDLLRIAALVAVGYVIYGGIQYVTSQGAPDSTRKAQQTIINALIGLVTAIMSAAIVAFIGTKLGS